MLPQQQRPQRLTLRTAQVRATRKVVLVLVAPHGVAGRIRFPIPYMNSSSSYPFVAVANDRPQHQEQQQQPSDPLVYTQDERSGRSIDQFMTVVRNGSPVLDGSALPLMDDTPHSTGTTGPVQLEKGAASSLALRGSPSREDGRALEGVASLIDTGIYYWFQKEKGTEEVSHCGGCPLAPSVSNYLFYPPFTFAVPLGACVRLTVLESTGKNVQYEISDWVAVVGYTSAPTTTVDCRVQDNLGACCTYGEFVFREGSHSLAIRGLSGIYDFGAIKLDTVACPSAPTPTITTRRPTPAPATPPFTAMPTRPGTGSGSFTDTSLVRGLWYTFSSSDMVQYVRGCGPEPAAPSYPQCASVPGVTASAHNLQPPWTYASSTCTRLVVTDLWYQDNYYWVYDNGVKVGTTRVSYGDGSFGGGPDCGSHPLVCLSSGKASWGEFILPVGSHSITIFSVKERDRGAFMVQTVDCPTKTPTKSPTKSPTKRPTKAPTSRPTRPPTKAPTKIPTKIPTATPTRIPTQAPVTKAPAVSCPALGNSTRFSLWNGNTNRATVATMVAGRSYCLSGNWNVRAVTLHEKASCGPVEITLVSAPVGGRRTTLRTFSDPQPKFFLFGDNPATGDVFGNAQAAKPLVLVKGRRYCVRSKDKFATGLSEVCFTQSC
jgi:cell division septation protein DedD